jgi:hypothetical protein
LKGRPAADALGTTSPFAEDVFALSVAMPGTSSNRKRDGLGGSLNVRLSLCLPRPTHLPLGAVAQSATTAATEDIASIRTSFVGNLWSIPMRIIRDDIPGFASPGEASRHCRRRSVIAVELLTTFALIGAIGIAAFAVTMEFAEAGALRTVPASAHGVAITALLLLLLGTGGLTAFATLVPARRARSVRVRRY